MPGGGWAEATKNLYNTQTLLKHSTQALHSDAETLAKIAGNQKLD